MRRVILLLVSVAALTIVAFPAQAQRQRIAQDRYCLQGRHWGFPGNCQFATRAQCMAAASGTNAFCGVNPRHAFARGPHRR